MKDYGRIVACGYVSQYSTPPEQQFGIRTTSQIIGKSATWRGFSVFDDEVVGRYRAEHQRQEEPAEEVLRDIDILIWGTGFDMNDFGGHFNIIGENGVLLSQIWKDNPESYRSVAVTGFPNLFLTLGPNSTSYWSNITTVVEIQIKWHCKMIQHIKANSHHSQYAVYPKVDVQKQFNDWLRENRGTPSFLEPTCATYHKTPAGATPMYNHFRIWNYYWKMRNLALKEFRVLKV
ncbi:hypothetical protein ACKLNR_013933 [Fusarium oxysporum f. sp. zingiberi]